MIPPAKMANTPAARKITSRVVPGTKKLITSITTPTAMLTSGFKRNLIGV
jgi:hypothetical protein